MNFKQKSFTIRSRYDKSSKEDWSLQMFTDINLVTSANSGILGLRRFASGISLEYVFKLSLIKCGKLKQYHNILTSVNSSFFFISFFAQSGLGRSFCKVDQDNAHNCRRGYNCNALRGGACSRDGGWCVCRIHDDISWLL